MSPPRGFGPTECGEAFVAAAQMLDLHAPGLDEINVFPVADHDTGANLRTTMSRVADGVRDAATFAALADSVRAAVGEGTDGHSGRMLGDYLVAFTASLVNVDRADVDAVAFALEDAAAAMVERVVEPRVGTMCTVATDAARAAMEVLDRGADLPSMAIEFADAAVEALERTPGQLTELAEHGVVDAGAAGLCVVLEALAAGIAGETPPRDTVVGTEPASATTSWEVRFTLDAEPDGAGRMLALLETLGDDVDVGGGPSAWECRVRVADIGAVVDAALSVGRPRAFDIEPAKGSP